MLVLDDALELDENQLHAVTPGLVDTRLEIARRQLHLEGTQ
jgi:hypothetical protein